MAQGAFDAGRTAAYILLAETTRKPSSLTQGRCRGRPKEQERAWITGPGEKGYDKELNKLALGECLICPAQWDCCAFSIKANAEGGKLFYCIWGAKPKEREKLAGYEDWEERLEEARARCLPVQTLVKILPKRADEHLSPRKSVHAA